MPTKVSLFAFEVANFGKTVLVSAALRSAQGNVNDAHRAGANRLQNQSKSSSSTTTTSSTTTITQSGEAPF